MEDKRKIQFKFDGKEAIPQDIKSSLSEISNEFIKGLASLYNNVIKEVVAFVKGITISKTIKDLIKRIIRTQNYVEKLFDLQWPLFLYGSEQFIENFVKKYYESSKQVCDEYISKYFNKKRINLLVAKWSNYQTINKERFYIINNAITLHQAGNYTASVSILVTQLYGVINENYKYIEILGNKFTEKELNELKKALELNKDETLLNEKGHLYIQMSSQIKSGYYKIYFIKYMKKYILSSTKNKNILKENPNRNKICHGDQLNFGTKKHSLKMILIFDALLTFKECYNENKK